MKTIIHLPTLRQLEYLIAVVELRHFGQAAERCFVTQSTLSAGIRELETTLGSRLVERTRRKVMPTPLGEEAAALARKIINLTTELVLRTRSDGTPLAGAVRLGVIPTIGPFLLPRALPAVRRSYPGLELYLREGQTQALLREVEEGSLDAAIIALPFDIGGLEHAAICGERFMVALPEGHPLAGEQALVAGALPDDELLLLEEGHCLTDHALAACRLTGVRASAAFRGTSLYTLVQMVAGGQGITFVPEMALAGGLPPPPGVCLVPLAEPGPHREVVMVWRRSYFRGEEMRLLAGEIAGQMEGGVSDDETGRGGSCSLGDGQ